MPGKPNVVGKMIQEYRRGKGMSQPQFAQQFGLKLSTLQKWERGLSLPDLENTIRLTRVLGDRAREFWSVLGLPDSPPVPEATSSYWGRRCPRCKTWVAVVQNKETLTAVQNAALTVEAKCAHCGTKFLARAAELKELPEGK